MLPSAFSLGPLFCDPMHYGLRLGGPALRSVGRPSECPRPAHLAQSPPPLCVGRSCHVRVFSSGLSLRAVRLSALKTALWGRALRSGSYASPVIQRRGPGTGRGFGPTRATAASLGFFPRGSRSFLPPPFDPEPSPQG